MIRALSTAATGMEAQQTRLDVTANNIANVSTTGFKKSRAEFSDLLYQTLNAPGTATGAETISPTGIQIGMGVRTQSTQRMHSIGEMRQTGNPLDVAIEGRGFLPVNLPSGEVAYTRNGALKIDAQGRFVTAEGYPLGSDITLPPDAQSVAIAADGTVSATVPGDTAPVQVGQMELVAFANPSGLESMGRNLFKETAASGNPIQGPAGTNGTGTLAQGSLEMSNVKIVEEMVDLISGQRAYEIITRVIRSADEMLQQTASMR